MMFDPPDFPYKELTETLTADEIINTDDLLFNDEADATDTLPNVDKDLVTVTEAIISTVENQLSLSSNVSGRFLNVENTPTLDFTSNNDQNSELYVVHSDNLFSYEPTLLDDYTVNQFLLPIQVPLDKNKNTESNEPDLLALHSCVICHETFTTDADLLDHTISAHTSDSSAEPDPSMIMPISSEKNAIEDPSNTSPNFECDWLVCFLCERVLSTALESEPRELLCCTNANGKSGVAARKLSTMFVCDYCSYLFADGEALDRHKLTCYMPDEAAYYSEQTDMPILESSFQDSNIFLSCSTCGKQFLSDEDLRSHSVECNRPVTRQRRPYSTGNANKMWNCGSCNQLFATARELYRHKRGEDRPPGTPLMAYVCEECDKVLGSMCALHTHKKMHKVSKPGYPCRVCGRRFNQSGHLAIHMRMHTGERPYPCDLCPKAFKVKVERDDHRRTHTGERPFACSECPKTFTAAARLREHARIHTDQRPYKCDICGAAFRRPYARTVHTLIHTGEKPHECDVCGTAFRRSGDMWKHKRTLHGTQGNCDGN